MKTAADIRSQTLVSKSIIDMLDFAYGDITQRKNWPSGTIGTIVNTANPTLMGSNRGVDGTLHKEIDKQLPNNDSFNQHICNELRTASRNNIIRCKRGHAVTTSGCGFCSKVIHVVGSKYDGSPEKPYICSSSCLHTLESCYHAIIEEIRKNPEIEEVGIPIIGAGEYEFPFELAINIAIASTGNALVDWLLKDDEDFNMASLKKIYFFIFDESQKTMNLNKQIALQTMTEYKIYFAQNKRVVFQTSLDAHRRYIKELKKYDFQRGYFTIARMLRLILLYIRSIFLLSFCLKDYFGKKDWAKRRQVVEFCAFIKAFLPVFLWYLLQCNFPFIFQINLKLIFCIIIIVCLLDTVSYLLVLIMLADIQRPSANIIRSMMMLFVNYFETSNDLAFLYRSYYNISLRKSLAFGFLGIDAIPSLDTIPDYLFVTLNAGLKFFLITLVFGYFFNHMHQRKFRS